MYLNRRVFVMFRVNPFSEGVWCAVKQNRKLKSYFPCKNCAEVPGALHRLNRFGESA